MKLPSKNVFRKRPYTVHFKTFSTYDEKGNLKETFRVVFDIRKYKIVKVCFLKETENNVYMIPTIKDFMSRRYSRRIPKKFDLISKEGSNPRIFDVVDLDS